MGRGKRNGARKNHLLASTDMYIRLWLLMRVWSWGQRHLSPSSRCYGTITRNINRRWPIKHHRRANTHANYKRVRNTRVRSFYLPLRPPLSGLSHPSFPTAARPCSFTLIIFPHPSIPLYSSVFPRVSSQRSMDTPYTFVSPSDSRRFSTRSYFLCKLVP